MTNPALALPSTEFGRWYLIEGEKYVSVTNVVTATDSKPFLTKWAVKLALESGDPDAADKYRDERAAFGTEFHDWAERWGLGLEPAVPLGHENRCVGFLKMIEKEGLEVEAVEATVFSPELGYAGTMDGLFRHPELGLLVVDHKTSKSTSTSMALQLVALRNATKLALPDGTIIPNPATDGAAIIHVTERGSKFIPTRTGPKEWEAFQSALKLALWRYKIAKEVFRKQ